MMVGENLKGSPKVNLRVSSMSRVRAARILR